MPILDRNIEKIYSKFIARKTVFIVASSVVLLLMIIFSAGVGSVKLSVGEIFHSLIRIKSDDLSNVIIWNLRLPRILMAIVAGSGLALSGAVFQAILKNPLASPFTIGISSAAGFGAALAIIWGFGLVGSEKYFVITNAFIFALTCSFLVYGISKIRGASPETIILTGIALMYLFGAATSLLQYIGTQEDLQAVVYWLFGSLSRVTWAQIFVIIIISAPCCIILMKYSWDLNALLSGDEVARALGVNVERVRIVSMILSTLITASIICFTGIIGFICLVAPHITRMIIGPDHRFLLPSSCIVGTILLLLSDTIGRTILSPVIIPVGIITSAIGVPFFLYLLLTKKRKYWQ